MMKINEDRNVIRFLRGHSEFSESDDIGGLGGCSEFRGLVSIVSESQDSWNGVGGAVGVVIK